MNNVESFKVGSWLVEPELNSISNESATAHLRPRVMDLLVFLAKQEGQVASIDDIVDAIWPNQIISQNAVYNCVTELRRILNGDSDAESIENIPKKGYRLTLPVTHVSLERSQSGPTADRKPAAVVLTASALTLFVVVAGIFLWSNYSSDGRSAGSTNDYQFQLLEDSIAILPFRDLSDDQSNEHFAEGIAEILIQQLSAAKNLQVIAQRSAFAIRDQSSDVREIGRKLGAEAVLDGAVERTDGQLGVTAQLVDTRSGIEVWSGSFDRQDIDIFDIQNEIAQAIVNELTDSEITDSTQQITAAPLSGLDAFESYLLARHRSRGGWYEDGDNAKLAVELYEQAISQDPEFAAAYAGLAEILVHAVALGYTGFPPQESLSQAKQAAERALSLNAELAAAHMSKGVLDWFENDRESAKASFKKVADLDPSYFISHRWPRTILLEISDFEDLDALFTQGEALDPLNITLQQNILMLAQIADDEAKVTATSHAIYELSEGDAAIADALRNFSRIEWRRGHGDKAIAYAELAAQISSDDEGLSSLSLATWYFILGDYGSAKQWLDKISAPEAKLYVNNFLYLIYFSIGDADQLEAHISNVIEPLAFQQDHPLRVRYEPHAIISNGLLGNCDRVLALGQEMQMTVQGSERIWAEMWLAYCHKLAGNIEQANLKLDYIDVWAEELLANSTMRHGKMHDLAVWYALRGNREEALNYLERAYDNGYLNYRYIEMDPFFVDYRSDERFLAVVTKIRREVDEMKQRLMQARIDNDWYKLVDVKPKEQILNSNEI